MTGNDESDAQDRPARKLLAAFVLAAVLFPCALLLPTGAAAQAFGNAAGGGFAVEGGDGPLFQAKILEHPQTAGASLVPFTGRYIVVQLTENRVYVFDGDQAVWSAPAGTGTGLKLDTSSGHSWKFDTPRGVMQVQRKEKDPIWEASDWYFIEKKLPIPDALSSSRKIPGVMGTTAIYLGDGIAIHGTGSPELLMNPDPKKRNVSHGCIRLTNEAARELFHMVDVGTPVLIY
jgi:lipoprotein-anchoring transpeptidase ErfK/SrfK